MYYDPNKTQRSSSDIQRLVAQAIFDYGNVILEKFGAMYKESELTSIVLSVDSAITRCQILTKGYKTSSEFSLSAKNVTADQTNSAIYTFAFGNEFYHPTSEYSALTSSTFTWNGTSGCSLKGSNGLINVVKGSSVIASGIGTVDYTSGTVVLGVLRTLFVPDSVDGSYLTINVEFNAPDILSITNNLLTINAQDISVSVLI